MSRFTQAETEIRRQLRTGQINLSEVMRSEDYREIVRDFERIVPGNHIEGVALGCWIRQQAREQVLPARD